ncbi:RluA family pseudouridine synthase [Flexithrix dorotheae]|uniref:RluA family pseudouridine synthase n=1 Tax=Flexithrix dorotheae TaxID=70993 RepID=UPI00036C5C3B|nr:RNA pseudouridine synthase [Flexithrix dorotheae]
MKLPKFEDLIVFENQNYILINKPYDISTLDERDISRPSIIKLARGFSSELKICHRLDKGTSGILAIAKNEESYRNLSLQFQKRKVSKIYHAFVNGVHSFEELSIEYPIAIAGKSAVRIDPREGKKSTTIVNTVKTFRNASLIEAKPLTGRMHQIRIHLAAKKAPLISDATYGGKPVYLSEIKRGYKPKKHEVERPLINRVALHAFGLKFYDGEEEIFVDSPYTPDLNVLIKQLAKNC